MARAQLRPNAYLDLSLSSTKPVVGPAIPPRIGVAKALTTALVAPGTSPTSPSTSLAITPSLASLPLTASCFSAASFASASPSPRPARPQSPRSAGGVRHQAPLRRGRR